MNSYSLSHLSDALLLSALTALVARDRTTTADLLAHIAEVDTRQFFLPAGYPSMHAYCVEELRLSEDAANKRIRMARKAREVPALFAAIADGRLNLSGAILLASHLTPDNVDEWVRAAERKSKAQIEALIAARYPRSEALPMVDTFPASEPAAEAVGAPIAPPSRNELAPGPVGAIPKRSRVEPIAQERYVLRACLGQTTLDKLHRAQSLLSHKIPNGDLAAILDRVLDLAIERLEKKKFGASSKHRPSKKPSSNPRYVPTHVKQAVWLRDDGQCTFVSEGGHRCTERALLEFDHVTPVARGGLPAEHNIRLRCRAHNQYTAEQAFGVEFVRRKRDEARRRAQAQRMAARESAAEFHCDGPGLGPSSLRDAQRRRAHARRHCW